MMGSSGFMRGDISHHSILNIDSVAEFISVADPISELPRDNPTKEKKAPRKYSNLPVTS